MPARRSRPEFLFAVSYPFEEEAAMTEKRFRPQLGAAMI
jgi:hypothetical protein